MNKRIAEVRKKMGMTQETFSDALGLTRNFISLLERGDRVPSDRTISDICLKFNVREDWLRTGEGDMMIPMSRDEEIASFMGGIMKSEDDDFRRRLVLALSKLGVDEWELLEKIAKSLSE